MEYIDIHAHLADPRIRDEVPRIADESRRRGVSAVLINAARPSEWPVVLDFLAYPGMFAALGLHPFFVDEWEDGLFDHLRTGLLSSPKCLAVGEIGLDFLEGRTDQARQETVFAAQLELACELRMPVILHNRRSWEEFFATWRNVALGRIGGVCHHFSSSREVARRALDAGLFLSFCGPITYPNARRIREVSRYVPLERILTETDAPDLPAAPFRGQFSYPWHVSEVVQTIAETRGQRAEEVAAQVARNFLTFQGMSGESTP